MELKSLLNAFFTALNRHIDTGFASLSKTIKENRADEEIAKRISAEINGLRKDLALTLDKISNPEFTVESDFSVIEEDLKSINEALVKIAEKETPETDKMEAVLVMIHDAIKANAPEKIGEKFDALDVVFKGLKPKDSVRFDDKQISALMAALTNRGGITTAGGVKSATDWDVARVEITSANTEYSYTFPANTVSWTMKLRTPGQNLFYASATGKLPVSGDNTTYMTMPPMGARSQDGVEWGGKIMYFESDGASQVVEIEVFTM